MDWRTHSQRNDWILMLNLNSRPTNKTSATFVCPMCLKFYVLFLHNSNYFSDYTMKAEPHHEHTISNEPRDDLIWRYDNNHHSTLILERRHIIARLQSKGVKMWRYPHSYWSPVCRFAFKLEYSLGWNTRTAIYRFHFSVRLDILICRNSSKFFFRHIFQQNQRRKKLFELILSRDRIICVPKVSPGVDFNFSPF